MIKGKLCVGVYNKPGIDKFQLRGMAMVVPLFYTGKPMVVK